MAQLWWWYDSAEVSNPLWSMILNGNIVRTLSNGLRKHYKSRIVLHHSMLPQSDVWVWPKQFYWNPAFDQISLLYVCWAPVRMDGKKIHQPVVPVPWILSKPWTRRMEFYTEKSREQFAAAIYQNYRSLQKWCRLFPFYLEWVCRRATVLLRLNLQWVDNNWPFSKQLLFCMDVARIAVDSQPLVLRMNLNRPINWWWFLL